MKLKKIEWRNIGPYGNKLQKLEFSDEGGLWMLLGKNGHGKSFVVNLPKILYYGRLDKFKKEDIANRINKHGWVKGEIETSPGTFVTIERNISPADLKVYKYMQGEEPNEDNDIGKAGIKNYQDYIDLEVTGLPYHIFSNIISLSVNDFKSFISMTPSDKRIIIDKLFAMEIINRMNDLVKKDLREAKINIDLYDREIVSLQNAIKGAQKELEKLKKTVAEDNTKRLEAIREKMLEYKPKLEDAYKKQKSYQDKQDEIRAAQKQFLEQKSKLQSSIKEINKKIGLYQQDKCPTCETPFNDKRFELVRGELDETIKKKQADLNVLLSGESKYDEALKKIQETLSKINEYIVQVRTAFFTLQKEFNQLKGDKPQEFQSIENIISKNSETIQKKETEKTVLDDKYKYMAILSDLYSDNGVKKRILESYLPTLNKEIEFTLQELHFPYELKFNSDFEPKLNHLGIEVNVETLSTGEKKRVDLAVLISIIRMLKRKYPSLNIFMLDEVLSS
ncbi:MAG TPA: AAA family ATPase, partial [Candidatus Paceibacterota bacterium]|nr:AAA family ATPase [Candidatus Paceibacterota bacterium]